MIIDGSRSMDRATELVLRYYSELSYEQIAGTLGLNRNHVATLIFRAKQELRRSLERRAVGLTKEPVQ